MPTILIIQNLWNAPERISVELDQNGYTLFHTRSGRQGVLMSRIYRPDLILSDIVTSDQSGLEILIDIRSDPRLHQTPFYIVTDVFHRIDAQLGMKLGANKSFILPSATEDLLNDIYLTFHQSSLLPPRIPDLIKK